jgi:hypothetical protein
MEGSGTSWESPRADLAPVILQLHGRDFQAGEIGIAVNTSIAVDKCLKAGVDLVTAVGCKWASMPTLDRVCAILHPALADHAPDYVNLIDVHDHRETKKALEEYTHTWLTQEMKAVLLLFSWALRTEWCTSSVLRYLQSAKKRHNRTPYTGLQLSKDMITYVRDLPQDTNFGWPAFARLSTMNPAKVSMWDPECILHLAQHIVKLETTANTARTQGTKAHITDKDKQKFMLRIYALKGLGGSYLSEHCVAAFLQLFDISADSSFLYMGSGSGIAKYGILRHVGIQDTADLRRALCKWAKENDLPVLKREDITSRTVAYTLCTGKVFAIFIETGIAL